MRGHTAAERRSGGAHQRARRLHVRLEPLREARQVDVDVARLAHDGRGAAELAAGVAEVGGVEERAAGVALVAARVLVATPWAPACDVAVSEELVQSEGVELLTCMHLRGVRTLGGRHARVSRAPVLVRTGAPPTLCKHKCLLRGFSPSMECSIHARGPPCGKVASSMAREHRRPSLQPTV